MTGTPRGHRRGQGRPGGGALGAYTLCAAGAVAGAVAAERAWLRTGIFRRGSYWLSLAIVGLFQVAVDGYLTKLPDPIVIYHPRHCSGVRFPMDIPVEDWAYGFSLVTLAMALWERAGQRGAPGTRGAR